MLDPYITPCCDQKLLRYFFERVDNTGYSTFFSEADYCFSQFFDWMIGRFPISEVTLAVSSPGEMMMNTLRHYLGVSYYMCAEKRNVPVISHLNLIVGKEAQVPDDILENASVTVARDTFTYNYLLLHRLWTSDASNTNLEADTEAQKANLDALMGKTQSLRAMLDAGSTTRLAYEELEGAWIDYMLSSCLATSTKGTFYTLHGIVGQERESVHRTSSVTCIKGKYAYDEVMKVLGSVLRTKKVRKTNEIS